MMAKWLLRLLAVSILMLAGAGSLMAQDRWLIEIERSVSDGWQNALHVRRTFTPGGIKWSSLQAGLFVVPQPSGWETDGAPFGGVVIDGSMLDGSPSFVLGGSFAGNYRLPLGLFFGVEYRLTSEWLDWKYYSGYVAPEESWMVCI